MSIQLNITNHCYNTYRDDNWFLCCDHRTVDCHPMPQKPSTTSLLTDRLIWCQFCRQLSQRLTRHNTQWTFIDRNLTIVAVLMIFCVSRPLVSAYCLRTRVPTEHSLTLWLTVIETERTISLLWLWFQFVIEWPETENRVNWVTLFILSVVI